jgi:hypothetical protein
MSGRNGEEHRVSTALELESLSLRKATQQINQESESAEERAPQARPNVLFEAGMTFGKHADRTVIVEFGKTRPLATCLEGAFSASRILGPNAKS